MRKYLAEFLGTMILVLIGCGSVAITLTGFGVTDTLAIAFAFGIALTAIIYMIGSISGAHVNPAVSLAMYINNKMSLVEMIYYWIAQIIGAIVGAFALFLLAQSAAMPDATFGSNVVSEQFTIFQAALFETIFTFIFVLTIIAVTSKKSLESVAGLIIGLTLTGIHIVGIPLDGTSVNPARSIGPALISLDPAALQQLWIFIVFPLLGGALAAFVWKILREEKEVEEIEKD